MLNKIDTFFFPPEKKIFLNHSWLISCQTLCLLRMAFFLYALGIYSMSNIINATVYKELKFLTYWGEILTMTSFLFLTLDSINYIQNFKKKATDLSLVSKIGYIIYELAFSYELTIVLLFWLVIHPENKTDKDGIYYLVNFHTHFGCLVLLWIEKIFNYIEFMKNHAYIIFFVGICYIITNIIATFAIQNAPVYSVLTWKNAMSYIYTVVCFFIFLFHFTFGIIIFRKFKKKRNVFFLEDEGGNLQKREISDNLSNFNLAL